MSIKPKVYLMNTGIEHAFDCRQEIGVPHENRNEIYDEDGNHHFIELLFPIHSSIDLDSNIKIILLL